MYPGSFSWFSGFLSSIPDAFLRWLLDISIDLSFQQARSFLPEWQALSQTKCDAQNHVRGAHEIVHFPGFAAPPNPPNPPEQRHSQIHVEKNEFRETFTEQGFAGINPARRLALSFEIGADESVWHGN
jgi:hypothetical protein